MTNATNPFWSGSMITDPQRFIGRREELAVIIGRLNGTQPQGSAVVGPRRIGKSSLLHYLYRPRADETLRPPARCHVIYLNAADGACATPNQFRATLLRAILHDLKLDRRKGGERDLAEARDKLAAGQPCTWEMGKEVLLNLQGLGWHPVACLDEFEALLTDAFEDRFFDALRSWANEGLLAWVTASARPLPELGHLYGRTSPFFNLLATVPLGGLTNAEAERLLDQANATPHAFTLKERRLVRRLAGNHPYHLQLAAERVWLTRAGGQSVSRRALRQYLCRQSNPPPDCARRQIRWHHLAYLLLVVAIVALLMLLWWRDPVFMRAVVDGVSRAARAAWQMLG